MSAYASKRTHVDVKRMHSAAMSYEAEAIQAATDAADLLAIMERWESHEDPKERFGLDVEDLLTVAIVQRSVLALRTWINYAPVNADTLLALLTADTGSLSRHIIYANWAEFGKAFTAPSLAPWHGTLFAHSVLTGSQDVARAWVKSGLISPSLAIPARLTAAPQWLWSWDPHLRNELDATLPLHLCLGAGQWALADLLWEDPACVDINTEDGRGMTPLDEVRDYLAVNRRSFANSAKIKAGEQWLDRLESMGQAQALDLSLPPILNQDTPNPDAPPPRRL